MIKNVLKSAVVALALMTGGAFAGTLEQAMNATYRLYHSDTFACSAVAISETTLVTAAHCIPQAKSMQEVVNIRKEVTHENVKVKDFSSWSVNVDKLDRDADVAKISLRDITAKLSFTDMASHVDMIVAKPVFAIGYPRGMELTLTDGIFTSVSDLTDMGVNGTYWKTTVPISGGSSGGGLYVFEEDSYKLVGLATASWRDVSFQSYFSTLNSLNMILEPEESFEELLKRVTFPEGVNVTD